MPVAERGLLTVLLASAVFLSAPCGRADSDALPTRVQVILVGRASEDPALSERIRSLFDPGTRIELTRVPRLDSGAVLEPGTAGILYLWIAFRSDALARVYVAAREPQGTRYLFREVRLESGLDEIGAETLAEIAHSSATALWTRARQTPKEDILVELARDTGQPESAARPAAVAPVSTAPPRAAAPTSSRPKLGVGVGAQFALHASGVEGWLSEPGGFAELRYRERLAVRVGGAYLVPQRFEANPGRVRLTGASSEASVGWILGTSWGLRARLAAGVGALFVHWLASATAAGREQRGYGVGSLGAELPLGPVWMGAAVELRVPFHRTDYDVLVGGRRTTAGSTWLSPGAVFEIGIPLTHSGGERHDAR